MVVVFTGRQPLLRSPDNRISKCRIPGLSGMGPERHLLNLSIVRFVHVRVRKHARVTNLND